MIPGCPNGETYQGETLGILWGNSEEAIPPEVKHLSRGRKRNQPRFPE